MPQVNEERWVSFRCSNCQKRYAISSSLAKEITESGWHTSCPVCGTAGEWDRNIRVMWPSDPNHYPG